MCFQVLKKLFESFYRKLHWRSMDGTFIGECLRLSVSSRNIVWNCSLINILMKLPGSLFKLNGIVVLETESAIFKNAIASNKVAPQLGIGPELSNSQLPVGCSTSKLPRLCCYNGRLYAIAVCRYSQHVVVAHILEREYVKNHHQGIPTSDPHQTLHRRHSDQAIL